MDKVIEKKLPFITLRAEVTRLGSDWHILLYGGSAHIGSCVLALPRPSLAQNGSVSSTSSVLNVTGHKDEEILRYIAQKISAEKNALVLCTGGVHMDNITKEQIEEIKAAVKDIAEQIMLLY